MDTTKRRSRGVTDVVAGGEGTAGGGGPPEPGAGFVERVRFRCERDRGFLATFYDGARPVCVIEAGDDVTYELPLVSRTGTTAVYSNGTVRLTLGSYPQAELYLGPGETLTECVGISSSV
jgi:hypothetical protein